MTVVLRRRQLMAGSAALLLASLVHAQPANKLPRIGILSLRSRPASFDADRTFSAFRRGLRELGYVEGRNVVLEWRFADGETGRLPVLAEELVRLKVDVIVTAGNQSIDAARRATSTTPIVIATSIDPVGSGFVRSLARPGGNVTGLSNLTSETSVKHVELLAAALPGLSRCALLVNPTNSAHAEIRDSVRSAAAAKVLELRVFEARAEADLEQAFEAMAKERIAALMVAVDSVFTRACPHIAALCAKQRIASVYATPALAEAGGLFGYGGDFSENFHRAAAYVDKILKGARPAELPVEQATKFDLTVNVKTARAIGINLPSSITLAADRIIE
jgi:putative ABC transport system substrate-binding protein